ncbi:MAG: pectin acetylesterase-family hydrolase [Acidimicrobiales bacterium]
MGVAASIAACSDDGDPATAASSTTVALSAEEAAEFELAAEFADCLRDHGLASFPDPQVVGDGFMLVGAPLTGPGGSEEWDAAQEACQFVFEDALGQQGEPGEQGGVDAGWDQVVPGGDCQCSDGSEFSFWVREADPSKLVLFLDGGGACFSAETCAPDRGLYTTAIIEGPNGEGVFDFADERNPFADYSVVYVPYCTGDVHLGDATTEYGPDVRIQHKGLVNGTAALDHLVAGFPDATEVVVMGESAGSVAAPVYAGFVSDRLPDATVAVVANGSGSYPDLPELNRMLVEAWGPAAVIPPWPETAGLTAEQWSIPGLFVLAGRHDPEIVFARVDYAYDERQAVWYPLVGIPVGDLLERLAANETQIEAAGVNLYSYIAAGDDHAVLSDGLFYTEEVSGQPLVDWVAGVVAGDPVVDVRCTDCEGG